VRHGFKAEAERRALGERELLGLTPSSRLDPVALAESKGYPVIPLGALPGVPADHVRQLRERDTKAFSATAVVAEGAAIIVVNDGHTPARQANSVAHEIAHLLLGHPPAPAFAEFGSRIITKTHEDEADWLAGCLLVPRVGIDPVLAHVGNDLRAAADHYGVSVELMRWRYNMTRRRSR
jgi:hypothetical protein